jgi:hypothetical protein
MAKKKHKPILNAVSSASACNARAVVIMPTSSNAAALSLTQMDCIDGGSVQIVRSRYWEHITVVVLLLILCVPTFLISEVVWGEWHNSPEQRGWLIIGFGFYIAAALKSLGQLLLQVCQRILYLRVELCRIASSTLFDAVSDAIALESEKLGVTCSCDAEAIQQHNPVSGDIAVQLSFWSSSTRCIRVCVSIDVDGNGEYEKLYLHIRFLPGEDVVCGRDSHVQRRQVIVLSTRTSSAKALRHKVLLSQWLQQCYARYMVPQAGIVNVYALQESSSDWMPEWKFERVKPSKTATGTGHAFFLERASLDKVLADAKLWSMTALRVYMITGPPGVGKSEFTIWLAGQLRLPVYRLCLSSPKLNDDRLAQLLSQTSVTHSRVLVQVDEFQGTVKRWMQSSSNSSAIGGVTPGGFCECLQGSTAMGCGVVVLTGTVETSTESTRLQFPAVFRRIHCVAELSWMTNKDIQHYFIQFLRRFVLECNPLEWASWADKFLDLEGPWARRPISVDMLRQFLMRQITESRCKKLGDFTLTPGSQASSGPSAGEFRVHRHCRHAFSGWCAMARKPSVI